MKTTGRIFGILSFITMVLGMIPFLGWLFWLGIPFAMLDLILSAMGKSNGGMMICAVAIIVGLLRLIIGGGIL